MVGSLIGTHSVRARGGATVWLGFHFSHLMEKESDAALIGFARWENLRLVWFDYVLTLHFRAYDTMSLHVYMHYGWMVGWLDGWMVFYLQGSMYTSTQISLLNNIER